MDDARESWQRAGYQPVRHDDGARAARHWWDANAHDYLDEHGGPLGDADFRWGPEGLHERDARLLGPAESLVGARVCELGAGAAQCGRWLVRQGAEVVATDVSAGMLAAARLLDTRTGTRVPAVQADATRLPFAPTSFDIVFTAYGAIPFVPDATRVHAEALRVLRPGGRWVFSVTHPVRWAFPDDPGAPGLTATRSYFDTTPYAERDESGRVTYVEYHRTLGEHVRDVVGAGFELRDVVEPPWPQTTTSTWGGWSPLRGRVLPGTAIFCARRPA
ncbi:MAG: class I SAM-dependent methyltransferase [Cellulomonadaceae bacterium]